MKTKSDARKIDQPYHYRDRASEPFTSRKVAPAFRTFCDREVFSRLKITGYKQDEKRNTLMEMTHALVDTYLDNKAVADTRSTSSATGRQRSQLWDLLEHAGLCRKCLGSEESGKATRYRATKRLMGLQTLWTDSLLKSPQENPGGELLLGLVVFKRKQKGKPSRVPFDRVVRAYAPHDKNGRPDKGDVEIGIAVTRVIEEFINRINSENLNHSWKAVRNGVYFQPNVELVQMHIREIYRGTRLYTPAKRGAQSLTKKERRRLKIDGSSVAEVDISGSLVRLAYNLRRIEVPAHVDVYRPDRIVRELWPLLNDADRAVARDFVKGATLRCFNVSSRAKAVGSVEKQMRLHPEKDTWPLAEFPSPKVLVKRIARAHRGIADDLFCGRGMRLISIEGGIMLEIMKHFVLGAKKPALPIHDALVVREQDEKLARRVMTGVYRQVTGFDPVLKS